MIRYRCSLFLLTSLAFLTGSGFVVAQEAGVAEPPAEKKPAVALPSGKEVLAKYVEAVGGAEKIKSVRSIKSTGEFAIPAAGLAAPMSMFIAQPQSALVKIEFPGMGNVLKGTNGEVAWEVSDIQGSRILEGKERIDFFREVDMLEALHPEKYFQSLECVAIEEVDGKRCLKVELTKKEGGKEIRFYDAETFLLSRMDQVQETSMGALQVSSTLSDYRDVDGMQVPHVVSIKMMGQDQRITTKTVELNPEIPAGTFDLPNEIKQLQAAEKEKESASE